MGQSRVSKFERMLKYQTNQIELLQQQISAQNALIRTLSQEHQQLAKQLQELQSNPSTVLNSVAAYQQCEVAMIEFQRLIKAKAIELAIANEKLDHLLNTYRDEDRRLNAWEKLVDRERIKGAAVAMNSDLRAADEIFLLTQLGRVER